MHSKSDNIEIMINDEADEVIKELFDSVKNRYQNNLESMKGSEFAFDYVHLLYYKCHKINPNRGGSYIDSPDWIKNKKATINPINKKDNKCFQYAVTVALNHEEIRKHAERITKIKPFINKYKLEWINFWTKKKMIETNLGKIIEQLISMFCMLKKKKYNLLMFQIVQNELLFLMILIAEWWHYLAVKKLLALLREITFKYHREFNCLNCLHSLATENNVYKCEFNRENKRVKIKMFVML